MIIGLGNPGSSYERTRHNAGFRAVDCAAETLGADVRKRRFRALVGEARHAGVRVALIKPQTFMNDSGASVVEAVRFYKTDLAQVILVYDDIDIPFGAVRVRPFGGPGTHNGMRSVIGRLGGAEGFPRVRVGIGKPPPEMDVKDFVLGREPPAMRAAMAQACAKAAAAALDIVALGIENAMNRHNGGVGSSQDDAGGRGDA